MKVYNIIQKRNWFFALSLLIILAGLVSGIIRKPNFDIDFVSGTVMVVNVKTSNFETIDIQKIVKDNAKEVVPEVLIGGVARDQVSIKTSRPLTTNESTEIFNSMKTKYNLAQTDLISVDTVAPIIGKELQRNAILAIILSSVIIFFYVAIRFSVMGGWVAGFSAIIALIHDILILLAVYLIAHFTINSAFIAATLTILGYSMNDTIIVYDRIRENEKLLKKTPIIDLVNISITQTLSRTINTVLTVVITITTLYVFGVLYNVEAIKQFTLPVLIGIISGSYSSIFIASSLYVILKNYSNKKEKAARV